MSDSSEGRPMAPVPHEPAPSWKFWRPVPTWQVALILVLCQVALTSVMVGLRTQLGVEVPFGDALGGAAGGALAYAIMRVLQRRRVKASRAAP